MPRGRKESHKQRWRDIAQIHSYWRRKHPSKRQRSADTIKTAWRRKVQAKQRKRADRIWGLNRKEREAWRQAARYVSEIATPPGPVPSRVLSPEELLAEEARQAEQLDWNIDNLPNLTPGALRQFEHAQALAEEAAVAAWEAENMA